MFILACGGETHCRLRIGGSPLKDMAIETEIDFAQEHSGSRFSEWEDEYFASVHEDHEWLEDTFELSDEVSDLTEPDSFLEYYLEESWHDEHYQSAGA